MSSLNPQQQQAVNHVEGPLLVLAGAGSGKTRVVTCRIAKLLERGVLPQEILAITFTNKAADEMRMRIYAATQQHILAVTFHSLCAKILRESIENLGYRRDFIIYDEEDCYRLLKNCFQILQLKEEKGAVKTLQNAISYAKNHLLTSLPSSFSKEISSIFPLYQAQLKESNALDFDDLLSLTVELLQKNKTLQEQYQKRWSFLLIDEYQDTNVAQYTIAKILAAPRNNICAVGDPDQSIYSWRGACYENILHFDTDFPHVTTIYLEENYRTTQHILSAANALIAYNHHRHTKNLWSQLGAGEKIFIGCYRDEEKEAQSILGRILFHRRNDLIPLEDCVIFYRTNAQSRIFEDLFLQHKIPYVIYGALSFYQRKEIKDLLSFLRLLVSDTDTLSLLRTIQIPKRGFGSATLERITKISEEKKIPCLVLCRELLSNKNSHAISLSSSQRKNLTHFLETIDILRRMVKVKVPLDDLLRAVVEKFAFLEYLQEDPDHFEDRKENVHALFAKAIAWQEKRREVSLPLFLEDLVLMTSNEEKKKESLRLMSLHNGKGLEFSLVFISGLEEDLFPHMNSKETSEGIEEERRLCYVGMTRAKKFLYMTHAESRFLWGSYRPMRPSRFLKELSKENIQKISSFSFPSAEEKSLAEEKIFSINTRVVHQSFGLGIIQKAYETSLGQSYDVFFEEDQITRSLIAKYAKLRLAD